MSIINWKSKEVNLQFNVTSISCSLKRFFLCILCYWIKLFAWIFPLCQWFMPKNVYFLKFLSNKCVNNILTLVKSSANRFFVPENGVCVGIRRFYMKKLGEISIFLRCGLKKHVFCYFRGFFGVKKFFGRRIRVFQPSLPLEIVFLKKIFFWKNDPKNWKNYGFFWHM